MNYVWSVISQTGCKDNHFFFATKLFWGFFSKNRVLKTNRATGHAHFSRFDAEL
jgi:hypothetical protein